MSRERGGEGLGTDDVAARELADDLESYLHRTAPPFYFPLLGPRGPTAPLHRLYNRFVRHWLKPRHVHRISAKFLYWPFFVLGAVLLAIVLLYFLKLKRTPLEVPSTYLWQRTIEDLHVNSL